MQCALVDGPDWFKAHGCPLGYPPSLPTSRWGAGGRWGVESASFMALLGVLNQPTMKCCQYEGLTSLSRGLSGSESAGKALGVHE